VLVGWIELEGVLVLISLRSQEMYLFVKIHKQSLDGFVANWVIFFRDGLHRDFVNHLRDEIL
jgi:hypothetical protein